VRDQVEAPGSGCKLDGCLMPVQGLASLLPQEQPVCKDCRSRRRRRA
jgi:hypothetical protein